MKNLLSFMAIVGLLLLISIFPTSNTEAQTTTISCPEGDIYTCYITADNRNVRKGKGRTIVTIE